MARLQIKPALIKSRVAYGKVVLIANLVLSFAVVVDYTTTKAEQRPLAGKVQYLDSILQFPEC